MCIICVEYSKERMTAMEAMNAFREIVPMTAEEAKHIEDASEEIWLEDWCQNMTQTE
jgi:RNase H-fold protein (predicted Holliday junction resolvase)|tara:strand:- start:1261 stop:1431 length:171 start_codon:yes stop_codon:yes gene_type:complete